MEKFELSGITLTACGIFGSNSLELHARSTTPYITNRYMIELPIRSGGTNYVEDLGYEIDTDTVFFIKPNTTRYTVFPLHCFSLHFTTEDQGLIKILDKIPICMKPQNQSIIYNCFFDMICISNEEAQNYEILLISKFFKLIALLIQASTLTNNSFSNSKFSELSLDAIKTAKKYIDDNYNEKITLKQLSDMVNLSPIYFQRIFTSATGKTPHKYLLDRRLKFAKRLLLISDSSLTEISNLCGFSSQSRFNVIFKQEEGITPTEYKKKNRLINYEIL